MRKFTVTSDMSGKHVVKACIEAFPMLKPAELFHALKRKDIRVDGKKTSQDIAVKEGQEVEVWLPDELFERKAAKAGGEKKDKKQSYKIAFETKGLLIINKPQGLAVHTGKTVSDGTLIDLIRRETGYAQAELCHRIDMNTGGLVMVAKNKKALEDAVALFKDNLITKRYRAIVLGTPDEGEPVVYDDGTVMYEIKAFLEKTRSGEVYIHDERQPHDLPIATRYRVIKTYKPAEYGMPEISEIECELVTGRTHQIRAQFAHLGYPVIGDGNYGRNKINVGFKAVGGAKLRHQQLYSTEILVGKVPAGNCHADISGKTFKIAPEYELDFKELGIKR